MIISSKALHVLTYPYLQCNLKDFMILNFMINDVICQTCTQPLRMLISQVELFSYFRTLHLKT